MIEILKDVPDGVVAVRASGTLTREEYDEVVAPLLDEARRAGRRLCCLCEVGSRAVPHENETPIPIFQTVLNGLSLRGSIVGARQDDLTEVFQLHRLGRTRVLRDHRPLERVNEAFTEALQGSAATRRIVFAI
jgi:D-arabinose 1-dehydrogenase-like Zn-dependent alcohol dehydrogenase